MTTFAYALQMDGGLRSTPFDVGVQYSTTVPLVPGMEIELCHYVDGGYVYYRYVVDRIVQSAQMSSMGPSKWRCMSDPHVVAHVTSIA